ncbi:pallidin-like [Planoprotostelium fungivorum]|uniref:Pallidin-like n=1 Tax=Planoprotostelium fungivorum TaxID=1890364 RepID=A0A2P6NLL0_9EUKA|nr:pallidin-like [Planoprotostelium fungivorum]
MAQVAADIEPTVEERNARLVAETKRQEIQDACNKLTEGLLKKVSDPFSDLIIKLTELRRNQEDLLNKITTENNRADYQEAIAAATASSMQSTNDRMSKLKKRADKLSQKKTTEDTVAAEKRERELQRERLLIARPPPEQSVETSPTTTEAAKE